MENFTGLDGWRGPSRSHSHANTGARAMMKMALADWNQLLGNSNAEERRPHVAIGEQVERRSGLFELGPEQRRRQEEDADHVEAPSLDRSPVAGEKQPAEEHHGGHEQQSTGEVGDLRRRDRQRAGDETDDEHSEHGDGHTAPQMSAAAQRRRGLR